MPLKTGSVSLANMRLSAVSNLAFVDFSLATLLTHNPGCKLIITDSASKKLTGYIKAPGTGENYNSELLSNGNMETGSPPTGWPAIFGTNPTRTQASDERTGGVGSYSLQLARAAVSGEYVGQQFSQTQYALYRGIVWGKNINCATGLVVAVYNGAGNDYTAYPNPSVWTQYTFYWTRSTASGSGSTSSFNLGINCTANGQNGRFDDASAMKVLTPSATGVTIVSVPDGSTQSWTSMDAGFKFNDTNYTYQLYTFPRKRIIGGHLIP